MNRIDSSPAHQPARRARGAIDDAVRAFREVPLVLDRAAIGDRLQRAIQHLYVVLDTGAHAPAHQDALYEGLRVLDEAHAIAARAGKDSALARALACVESARGLVSDASNAVSDLLISSRGTRGGYAPVSESSKSRPFRASVGVPQLHALVRDPIARAPSLDPIVDIASPPKETVKAPTPKTLEELRAFGAAARSGALAAQLESPPEQQPANDPAAPVVPPIYVEAIDEGEAQRRIARDCLEDIASLSILRKPIESESWLDQGPFEQRMLNALDAFASFGPVVLPMVSLYHAEASAPDPARGFATAFVLGCVEGSDTIDVALATMDDAPIEERSGFIEGFALAASPAIDSAMLERLDSDAPERVAIAVEVLALRGTLPPGHARGLLSREDRAITLAVARALGGADGRDEAIKLLSPLAEEQPDDELFFTAIESLLRRGHGAARELLRRELDKKSERASRAAYWLCLAGRGDDLDPLLEHAWNAPSALIARGLGRFGHIEAVSTLMNLLANEDPKIVQAAAESLDRITNAGLRTTVDEPWDLGRAIDPDFEGQPMPTRKVDKVFADPAAWEDWRTRVGYKLPTAQKRRAGLPFTPTFIVDELESRHTPVAQRAEAAIELALATGTTPRFSTSDWVVRQQQMLANLREDARRVSTVPGGWCFGGAGSLGR